MVHLDDRRAAVAAEVAVLGVDEHRHVPLRRRAHHRIEHPRGHGPLGVVAHHDRVGAGGRGDLFDELLLDRPTNRVRDLSVESRHLLTTHGDALLGSGHAVRGDHQTRGIDAVSRAVIAYPLPRCVLADHADEHRRSAQRRHLTGHVRGTAQMVTHLGHVDDRDRGLRRDPIRRSLDVLVEHHVADDEHRGPGSHQHRRQVFESSRSALTLARSETGSGTSTSVRHRHRHPRAIAQVPPRAYAGRASGPPGCAACRPRARRSPDHTPRRVPRRRQR